jgi:hypothetical protein
MRASKERDRMRRRNRVRVGRNSDGGKGQPLVKETGRKRQTVEGRRDKTRIERGEG